MTKSIAGWSAASFLAVLFIAAAFPAVTVLVAPNANADGPFWDLVFWAFRKALWFASPHGVLMICAALAIVAHWRGWMDKPPAKDMAKHELDKYQG